MSLLASPSLESRLMNLIAGQLLATGDGFGPDSNLFEAGLDSMSIMQLLLLIEEEFGVAIPVDQLSRENFATVSTIARLVRGRMTGDGAGESASPAGPVLPAVPPTAGPPAPEPAPATPATPATPAAPEPGFPLPLLNCDHFVLAFDLMMRESGQGGHIAHSVVELAAPPDLARLREALREMAARHPLIGATLHRRWGFVGPWEWRPATVRQEIPVIPVAEAGSPGALAAQGLTETISPTPDVHTATEDWANTPLDRPGRHGWTKARMVVIERRDGSARLIFSWSHLMLDGVGAQIFLAEVSRLMADPAAATADPVPALERPTPTGRNYLLEWQNSVPMVRYFNELLNEPFDSLGARRPTPGKIRFRTVTLDEPATARVLARCTALCGPLVNLPFYLAAAMRAHDRVFQARGKRPASQMVNVPIQSRRKGARGPIFQNHLGMFFARLSAAQLDRLDSAVQALLELHGRWLREKLGESFDSLMSVMRPMPPRLHMRFIQWQMRGQLTSLFHSHTGEFARDLTTFGGVRVTGAYHVPGFSNPPGTGLFCNECHGRLVITQCWREGVLTEAERALMLDAFLQDLGAHE